MDRFFVKLILLAAVAGFILLIFGAALVYARIFGPALWVRFLQRTGYRRRADPTAPIEAQARAILSEIFQPQGIVRGPWIREVEGMTMTYNALMYGEGEATVTEESWMLELPRDLGFLVQVLERRIAEPGLVDKLKSAALGRERRWGQLLPKEVRTGDAAFDARFLLLVNPSAELPAMFLDPAARGWITSLPEACLTFAQKWIVLDDPAGALRRKHVGLSAATPAAMMDREPASHDQVAQTLAALARFATKA